MNIDASLTSHALLDVPKKDDRQPLKPSGARPHDLMNPSRKNEALSC